MANVLSPSKREQRLENIYGPGFPDPEKKDIPVSAWRSWILKSVNRQSDTMRAKRLHWARHRLFKQGRQWISTRDGRTWRELSADENRIRSVFNHFGPAIDFRLGILQEQRPGFKYNPIPGSGVQGRETAQAQQSLAEYIFNTQKIWDLFLSAAAAAQTDGVSFLNVYMDKGGGPLLSNVDLIPENDPRFGDLVTKGYPVKNKNSELAYVEIPLNKEGEPVEVGITPSTFRGGEVRTRLILAQDTYVDPEARCISGADKTAKWFMVRRVRDLESVKMELGTDKIDPEVASTSGDPIDLASSVYQSKHQRGLPAYPSNRNSMPHGGVYENLVYIAPSPELDEGLWLEVIGDKVARRGDLPKNKIPIARITDGSMDDDFYPRAICSDWVGDQTTINAVGSKIQEQARASGGDRLLAMEGTVIKETFTDVAAGVLNYKGVKPDVMPAMRASIDLWRTWDIMVRQLENKTGWNDIARGQLTGEGGFQDIAGRAILAARELFERQFGPMIRASARGMTDWSELVIQYAQHFYDTPRMIPMVGRPDLAKAISGKDLEGPACVYVDPETLQPLPRALKNQLLTDYLQQGLITVAEFKKRAPYAEIRDLNMGDTDQWARAQLINTLLEDRWEELWDADPLDIFDPETGLPCFWQDDPKVHKLALEELIYDDKKPIQLRTLAMDRWGIYLELERAKDFPFQLEIQGFPRPVAPAEVLGVPNPFAQSEVPSTQQMAEQGGAPEMEVPGGVSTSPAPEMSPSTGSFQYNTNFQPYN